MGRQICSLRSLPTRPKPASTHAASGYSASTTYGPPPTEAREETFGEFEAYLDARIAEHAIEPQDDLTSYLLSAELDGQRRHLGLTWPELAAQLRCTPSQLTGIRRARFAIGMSLAMRIAQWLGRPASHFVYVADW